MIHVENPLPFDDEIAELSVFLPGWQVTGLERAAHQRGLTVAQMLRRLVNDFLTRGQRGQGCVAETARQWA
ncbi:MAG: hypothetical protein IT429_22435 [Gemmataceae bacterium]|nr:hypothetical protein [Gemmataceae bacterium]